MSQSTSPSPPALISGLSAIADKYDVLLCDVWGVVHDGQKAYPGANQALPKFRAKGGTVVLVSNAPMPSPTVAELLDDRGVLRSVWDDLVTSGDIALAHIAQMGYRRVYGIGPRDRDAPFFDQLPALTSLDDADCIACTGLIDDRHETAEQYRALMVEARARNLPFVCANPDLAVHVGPALLPCAGAIATIYEGLGGDVMWCGKPHPSAYAAGLERAAKIRGAVPNLARVLGVGDAVRTDLASARGAGVDGLFIASGLHRDEIARGGQIDIAGVARLLATSNMPAAAVLERLVW